MIFLSFALAGCGNTIAEKQKISVTGEVSIVEMTAACHDNAVAEFYVDGLEETMWTVDYCTGNMYCERGRRLEYVQIVYDSTDPELPNGTLQVHCDDQNTSGWARLRYLEISEAE